MSRAQFNVLQRQEDRYASGGNWTRMATIPIKPMGSQGLKVPQQGFGLMGLSGE